MFGKKQNNRSKVFSIVRRDLGFRNSAQMLIFGKQNCANIEIIFFACNEIICIKHKVYARYGSHNVTNVLRRKQMLYSNLNFSNHRHRLKASAIQAILD